MWKKRNHFGAKFALCSVVLLAVCSCAWAFPGRGKSEAKQTAAELQQEIVPVKVEEVKLPQPSLEVLPLQASGTEQEKISAVLLNLQTDLENQTKLNKEDIHELKEVLKDVQADVNLVIADAEQKEAALETALKVNSEQADTIVEKNTLLKKEQGTKAFAKINGVIGFEGGLPTWGTGLSIGLRFGKGLLLEAGANYMIGNFITAPIMELDLDRLQITASIGWEW